MMMMMTIMKTLEKAEMAPKDFAIIKQAIWYLSGVTPAHRLEVEVGRQVQDGAVLVKSS